MIEVQDIKEQLTSDKWKLRVEENPKRIYALLLCTDEHETFLSHIQKAWRTLDALSGEACDVFTLERQEGIRPDKKFDSPNYFSVEGGTLGKARVANVNEFDESLQRNFYPNGKVAVDTGILLPDRTQSLEIKNMLFEKPRDIILPGLAVFPSAFTKEATYYKCNGLDDSQLSESFQQIFASIQEAYEEGNDRFEVFDRFQRTESFRYIKERLTTAIMQITLKDIFSILIGGIGLALPKGK